MKTESKIAMWKEIFKNDEKEARNFYYENLFDKVVVSNFLKKGQGLANKFEYLISMVGFSPQPIILLLYLIRPEKSFFICSKETERILDEIIEHYPSKSSEYEKVLIDSTNMTTLYGKIKEIIKDKDPKRILIDITGGKKVMSGGATLAAGYLGIETAYVDSEYIPEMRLPEPGTEYPVILENPLKVLGEVEVNKAISSFNDYNFSRACEVLGQLEHIAENVWMVRKYLYISRAYQYWHEFFIKEAKEEINKILEKKTQLKIDTYLTKALQTHLETLEKLDSNEAYRIMNFFFSGLRYIEIKRFDITAFLMYRVIEKTFQARLLEEYGFNVSKPDYTKVNLSEEIYKQKQKEIYEKEYREASLPRTVALMDGAAILSIKEDLLVQDLNLKDLRGVTDLRNKSVYAHGETPLREEEANKIKRTARKLVEKYLELKEIGNIESHRSEFEFPKLKEI